MNTLASSHRHVAAPTSPTAPEEANMQRTEAAKKLAPPRIQEREQIVVDDDRYANVPCTD